MANAQNPTDREMGYVSERLREEAKGTEGTSFEVNLASDLAPAQKIVGMALYGRPNPDAEPSVWDTIPSYMEKYGTERWRILRILRFARPVNMGHRTNFGVPKPLSSWSKKEKRVSERALDHITKELDRRTYTWNRK